MGEQTEIGAEAASRPAPSTRSRALARVGGRLLSLVVLAGGLGLAAMALDALEERAGAVAGPAATPPLPVETIEARLQEGYAVEERFAGRVEAARSADLAFERPGRLEQVLVDEGDRVAEGQALAALDTALLEAQRDQLAAERVRLVAQLKLAERTQARQGDLSAKGFASDQRFDEAETEAMALTAQIAATDAQIHSVEIEIEKSTLRAPFAGEISARRADPGAMLPAGQPVAALLESARPQARIGVTPDRAAALTLGARYPLEVGGRGFEATLVSLTPGLSTGTRTLDALFDLIIVEGAPLRFGEIARLSLPHDAEGTGFWLPLAALQEGEKGLWSVYLLLPEKSSESDGPAQGPAMVVERTSVEVLHVADGRAFVSGGLADGDLVVASGVNRLSRGQRVRPIAPENPVRGDAIGLAVD